VTPLAVCWGWRSAFWATGVAGAAWLLWLLQGRRPDLRSPRAAAPRGGGLRWRDPRLWGLLCVYAAGALPLAFVLYAAPLYLGGPLRLSQSDLGRVLWIPPLGLEVGFFFWGWVVDRLGARGASSPAVRRLFVALAVLGLPLALAPGVGSAGMVVAALTLAAFLSGGFIVGTLAWATNAFPSANSGMVAGGASSSWSALVAVAMPFFGWAFDRHAYGAAFFAAAAAP